MSLARTVSIAFSVCAFLLFGCSSAHTGVGADAGHAVVAGDTCDEAGDFSPGGVFHGTTCGQADDVLFPCGGTGTPDVFYKIIASPGATWSMSIDPPDFNIQQLLGCGGVSEFCAMPVNLHGSFDAGGLQVFSIEKMAAGACGDFTLTFDVH